MPASIGVNLRVTGHCSQGGRKYMEDLFSVAYQQTEDERDLEYAFFGIYDGHGGCEAAAFAKEHLMDSIVKQRQFWSDNDDDVLKAIRNGYMLTHMNMWKELEKWPKTVTGLPSTAGTTASVAFIRRGKIYIGHVGDSAIVLGYQKDGEDAWAAKALTMDHKPESATEMERILQTGGKVISKAGVPRVVWNRPRPGHKGPIKKSTPMDEIPFLAVARSLGDLWSYNLHNDEFIVSPDPDVGVLDIDPSKFRCLIFGTDGLWNMISPEGAVNLVQATERHNEDAFVTNATSSSRDWLNPSKSLVDHALQRWSSTRMRADNTSVVTLMLDPPGPPRASVLRSRTTAQKSPTPVSPSDHQTDPADKHQTQNEQRSESENRIPQNGLTIMTRYSDNEKTPDAEKTPLPPCNTLDGRFSISTANEQRDAEEPDKKDIVPNYGNPSESYFMARVLNRSCIVNTLSNVFNEIVNSNEQPELPEHEPSPGPMTSLGEQVKNKEEASGEYTNTAEARIRSSDPTVSTDKPPEQVVDAKSIQINEVSSSSPVEVPPKPRGRKSKGEKVESTPQSQGRTLRSHDAESTHRPQTRQASNKRDSNPKAERVVILSRAKGITLTPAIVRIERSADAKSLTRKSTPVALPAVAHTPETRSKNTILRSTRSRDSSTQKAPKASPILKQNQVTVKNIVKRVQDEVPEGRTDSKENFGRGAGARRRAHPPSAPARPSRRCRPEDPEVHSTTSEMDIDPKPRALRSRNDDLPSISLKKNITNKRPKDNILTQKHLLTSNKSEDLANSAKKESVPAKRPSKLDEDQAPAGKAPKLNPYGSRSMTKRSTPWSTTLNLRNRLRKRLSK